jgi:MFS family permease
MRIFPKTAGTDAKRIVIAKGLRAIGDGYVTIVLPAYLLGLGYSGFEVGALMTATLLGSAIMTLLAGLITARFGDKRPLLAASGLMIFTGLGFAGLQSFWPLLIVAFIGTLNPSSGDVSVFLPLEQSLLARSVDEKDRTLLFASYSVAGSLMGAFGTLVASFVDFAPQRLGVGALDAMRMLFLAYAGIGVAAALIYRGISEQGAATGEKPHAALGPSRRIVYRLAALFAVDAFGGGFLVQTILALWLFQSFHLPVSIASTIFFWTSLFTAASYFVAVRIARRFGLVNTMVFTHLPASICLVVIPFVSNLGVVVGLLLLRSALSQMDVPTRTSYVMAVVTPPERAAAASLTSVPRSLAPAISPIIAGYLLSLSSFGWPLVIGGVLKVAYDLSLLAMFRQIRPPEEIAEREPLNGSRRTAQ